MKYLLAGHYASQTESYALSPASGGRDSIVKDLQKGVDPYASQTESYALSPTSGGRDSIVKDLQKGVDIRHPKKADRNYRKYK